MEKRVLNTMKEDMSMQDWLASLKATSLRSYLGKTIARKNTVLLFLPFALSNSGFNPTNFISEANAEGCTQVI